MSQGYRLRKRESFGAPFPIGQDPLPGVGGPPGVSPFVVGTVEVVVRDSGFPTIVLGGACPALEELSGWMLVATSFGRDLVFGGVHRLVRWGPEAPMQRFFTVPDAPMSLHGLLAAAQFVDVLCFGDDDALPEGFVFTFVRSSVLLGRASSNEAFSQRRVADHQP